MSRRGRPRGAILADVDAVRQLAGVGDQSPFCENGTRGCPGPDAPSGHLPCASCFVDGGGARVV